MLRILYVDIDSRSLSNSKARSLLGDTQYFIKKEIEERKIGYVEMRHNFQSDEINNDIKNCDVLITHYPSPYPESLKKIKWVRENYPAIKIILFTGSQVEKDIVINAGASHIIRKANDYWTSVNNILIALKDCLNHSDQPL